MRPSSGVLEIPTNIADCAWWRIGGLEDWAGAFGSCLRKRGGDGEPHGPDCEMRAALEVDVLGQYAAFNEFIGDGDEQLVRTAVD